MTPEGEVKKQVKEFLDEIGAWYYMPVPMGYGRTGIKDFLGIRNGRGFGIETKSLRKDLKAHQVRETEYMCANGAVVFDFSPTYHFEDFKRDFIKILG